MSREGGKFRMLVPDADTPNVKLYQYSASLVVKVSEYQPSVDGTWKMHQYSSQCDNGGLIETLLENSLQKNLTEIHAAFVTDPKVLALLGFFKSEGRLTELLDQKNLVAESHAPAGR